MSVELVSVAVGALGSVVSLVTFVVAKQAATSTEKKEKTYVIKNKNGESREVTLKRGSTHQDISKLVSQNIEYEKLVERYLKKLGSSHVTRNSKHELGYDFYFKSSSGNYYIEAKANSKPLNRSAIEKIIKVAREHGSQAVVISKSGFDKSVKHWLRETNSTDKVKLYTAKNATEVRKALNNIS